MRPFRSLPARLPTALLILVALALIGADDEAVDDARRMYLQQPVLDKIESARGPLEKLAGYYGVKLDPQLEMR